MNVLEKILEEIDSLHNKILKDKFAEKVTEQEIDSLAKAKKIIRSHMDHSGDDTEMGGWIPVSKGLPKPYKIVEVTVHCSEWISDYDSVWVPENEKVHHGEEYLTRTGYINKDEEWIFYDQDGCEFYCEKEFGSDKSDIYNIVTAWQPLPEPYKEERDNAKDV